jgi:hypothetical protein
LADREVEVRVVRGRGADLIAVERAVESSEEVRAWEVGLMHEEALDLGLHDVKGKRPEIKRQTRRPLVEKHLQAAG